MQRIYNKLKGKKVKYPDCEGIVCGYSNNRLILATETSPSCSYRRLEKGGGFIEEIYKDTKYRYMWADEIEVYKSNPDLSYL